MGYHVHQPGGRSAQSEKVNELRLVNDSEFRSNHASNYLPIKAHLPDDQGAILRLIETAIQNPQSSLIRPEFLRGL